MLFLQSGESLVCQIVLLLHSSDFLSHSVHVGPNRLYLLMIEGLDCVVVEQIWFPFAGRLPFPKCPIHKPGNFVVELLVHHVYEGLGRLMAEDFVLVRNAWSHIVDLSNYLFAVADELAFVVELTLVQQVSLVGFRPLEIRRPWVKLMLLVLQLMRVLKELRVI